MGTLFAVLALGPGLAHAAGWLKATPVNNSHDVVAPSATIDATGNVVMAWTKNPAGLPGIIQGAQRVTGAGGFAALPDFSAPPANTTDNDTGPVVVRNRSGQGIVAWINHTMSGGDQLQVLPIQPNGAAGTIRSIGNGGGTDTGVAAAINANGDAVVAWENGSNLTEAVTRQGAGGTFGPDPAEVLGAAPGAPYVAIDGAGDAIVVWASNIAIEGRRHAAGAPAATWTAELGIPTGTTTTDAAVAANPSGRMVVAWHDATGDALREVPGTVSGGWGATPPITTLAPTGVSHGPGVTVDDAGGAAVAWSTNMGAGGKVQVSLRPAGGAFQPATDVQPVPVTPSFFSLAGNGKGAVIVAWYAAEPAVNVVRAAVKPAGSQTFGASQIISALNPAVESTNPVLALDENGDGVAGLQLGNSGSPLGIGAAIYDNTPPQLGAITGPTSVKNSTAAAFSVPEPTDTFSAVTVSWSFGDGGAAATGTQVTHTFTKAGTFTVKVTATDVAGNAASAPRSITVTGPPKPPLPKCKVPKLKGKTLSRARTLLGRAHCKLGKVHKPKARKHHKLRKLVVKSSSPGVGVVRTAGRKVAVTLVQVPKPKPKHKKHK